MKTNQILQGDVIEQLKTIPNQVINCVITSPPYYGLRDYGLPPTKWPAVSYAPMSGLAEIMVSEMFCCLGLEDTIEAYIGHMVLIFRELRRVLRGDGTVWLNLGDSFSDKQLLAIPWRVALALQADGWYLRSDIIWHKANPMPESVTDRPTKAHEYIFLLSKSKKYWYDQDAIREAHKEDSLKRYEYGLNSSAPKDGFISAGSDTGGFKCDRMGDHMNYSGRNARTVWTADSAEILSYLADNHPEAYADIADKLGQQSDVWKIASAPFKGAHFAVFPPALVEKCLLAGCPSRVCVECGTPWVRVVERDVRNIPNYNEKTVGQPHHHSDKHTLRAEKNIVKTIGFAPACQCCPLPAHKKAYKSGVVLDPFFGSGTTGAVAEQLGRNWIGIDLNPGYVEMAKQRLAKTQPILPGIY